MALASLASADTLTKGPFTVEYHPDDHTAAEGALHDLLAARNEFSAHLPLGEAPVTVRIAHTMNEFLGLSGRFAHVGVSGVTRADQSSIVLKSPRLRSIDEDFRGTVRHELIHVLLHRNTDTQRLPRWLNEGICMMLANEIRWESAIDLTRMHLTGQIIPLESLDRAFMALGSERQFGDAYSQALTMTRALHDEVGEEAFWAVVAAVRTEPFSQALADKGGISLEQFWADFNGGLWGLSLITTLRTGSFWGVITGLCLVTGLARWWRNRRIMRGWEREELEESEDVFDWDRILDDADTWKGQKREDG
jgi:hypothetical protein